MRFVWVLYLTVWWPTQPRGHRLRRFQVAKGSASTRQVAIRRAVWTKNQFPQLMQNWLGFRVTLEAPAIGSADFDSESGDESENW